MNVAAGQSIAHRAANHNTVVIHVHDNHVLVITESSLHACQPLQDILGASSDTDHLYQLALEKEPQVHGRKSPSPNVLRQWTDMRCLVAKMQAAHLHDYTGRHAQAHINLFV